MADFDNVGRIGYVLDNYDNVELLIDKNGKQVFSHAYNNSDGSPSPMV